MNIYARRNNLYFVNIKTVFLFIKVKKKKTKEKNTEN